MTVDLSGLRPALLTIAAFGGVGAFIDFWISKERKQKIRTKLEDWWLIFSDVKVKTFSYKEARYAVTVMDWLFGERLLSFRRARGVALVSVLAALFPLVTIIRIESRFGRIVQGLTTPDTLAIAISLVMIALSISITRFFAVSAVKILRYSPWLNISVTICLLLLQYCVFAAWLPLLEDSVGLVSSYTSGWPVYVEQAGNILKGPGFEGSNDVSRHVYDLVGDFLLRLKHVHLESPQEIIQRANYAFEIFGPLAQSFLGWSFATRQFLWILAAIPNFGRFALTLAFTVLCLLKPLHQVFSTMLLRITESDKPIFTLLFSGGAAILKTTSLIIGLLS